MTILEMLNRLAEKAPDVCKCNLTEDTPEFSIGEFGFFFMDDKICSSTHDIRKKRIYVTGRPATAWLADAIMAECEKRGWQYELYYSPSGRGARIEIASRVARNKDKITALLAAFLAVIEGER